MKRYQMNIKDAQGSKKHEGFMENWHDDVRSDTWQMKVQNDFLYVEKVMIWIKRVQETQRSSRMLRLYD